MSPEIMIVGLKEIGASIGLALAQTGVEGSRTGYDADAQVARGARKAGAVNRLALNLGRSCRSADLVILAVPSCDVLPYLEAIGPGLKPGALVLDTSSLKSAAIGWAAEHLPEGCSYVGAVPVVNPTALHVGAPGLGKPRADLFQGGLMAMVIPAKTPEAAVELALSVARQLGAAPFFIDPAEVDAVMATVEGLPALLAVALMRVAVQTPGWREARRIAGRQFANLAIVGALQSPQDLQASLGLNRNNVLARVDSAIEELQSLRTMIAQEEAENLKASLAEAVEAHDAWLAAREQADWGREELGKVELPEGGMFDRLLGIGGNLRPKDRR